MQKARIYGAIIALGLILCTNLQASAEGTEPELIPMHATAYCLEGITASGTQVREGIAATGRREWLGMTAIVYQRKPDGTVGEIIGIYEIQDTGCKPSVIDVWKSPEDCQPFMDRVYEDGCRGKVYVQIIEAEG